MGKYKSQAIYAPVVQAKLLCGHNDCYYASQFTGTIFYCNYIGVTGHSRPSEPTPNCRFYSKKERENRIEQICFKNWEV